MTVGVADWGPLIIPDDVDQAVLGVLKLWLPTYIAQIGRERNLTLAKPTTYDNYIDIDEVLDRELPAIVVTTARTRKVVGGVSHTYTADWDVQVMSIMRGPNRQQTKKLAGLMEGCVRRCMIQKARSGVLAGCHWIESEITADRNATGHGRYLAAGIGKYNVATDAAAQGFGGPDVPDATSYAPLAVVTDVVIDVESED